MGGLSRSLSARTGIRTFPRLPPRCIVALPTRRKTHSLNCGAHDTPLPREFLLGATPLPVDPLTGDVELPSDCGVYARSIFTLFHRLHALHGVAAPGASFEVRLGMFEIYNDEGEGSGSARRVTAQQSWRALTHTHTHVFFPPNHRPVQFETSLGRCSRTLLLARAGAATLRGSSPSAS